MKAIQVKYFVIILISYIIFVNFPAIAQSKEVIEISVDPRVELTSIIFRLTGKREYNKGEVKSYVRDVEKHFSHLRDHPAVKYAEQLINTRGIAYNAPMNIALYINSNFEFDDKIPFSDIDNRWRKDEVINFIKKMKQFSEESNFYDFYSAHTDLYMEIETEAREIIQNKFNLEWFTSFFGAQSNNRFKVILCLLNGRFNYSAKIKVGEVNEFYCFKGIQPSIWGRYFGDATLGTLAHEFLHSYINPLVDSNLTQLEKTGKCIFSHVQDKLKGNAYGSWQIMYYESLTIAVDLHYRRDNGISNWLSRYLRIKHNERAGFIFISDLYNYIDEYRKNRAQYPTFDTFIPKIVEFFEMYCDRLEN
ncbi:MAG: DUF4932 domain-containing protein [Calditrichaeota bacterium]|nr:DUF4932 domain-containing protein [Calditrichota bacterium]